MTARRETRAAQLLATIVPAALCVSVLLLAPASAEAAPSEDVWVAYQGNLHWGDRTPTGGTVRTGEGDGFLPQFAVRLRGVRADGSIDADLRSDAPAGRPTRPAGEGRATAPTSTRIRIAAAHDARPLASAADGASLLLRLANLRLPAATASPFVESVRRSAEAGAWPWRRDRIRTGSSVALNVDLRADASSDASRICRSVPVEISGAPSSDRCSIEAILDARDGWPIVVQITRTVETAAGASATHSVDFGRLPGSRGSTAGLDGSDEGRCRQG